MLKEKVFRETDHIDKLLSQKVVHKPGLSETLGSKSRLSAVAETASPRQGIVGGKKCDSSNADTRKKTVLMTTV